MAEDTKMLDRLVDAVDGLIQVRVAKTTKPADVKKAREELRESFVKLGSHILDKAIRVVSDPWPKGLGKKIKVRFTKKGG
jgi:hypothetical protein